LSFAAFFGLPARACRVFVAVFRFRVVFAALRFFMLPAD
jgi:hypothetical protein